MAAEAKNPASEKQEKAKPVIVHRPFIFQGQEYDLNTLTDAQKEYLSQFPNEVPFLQ